MTEEQTQEAAETPDRIDELTAFEVTQAERACGVAFESLQRAKDDHSPGRTALFGALAWVHSKRAEPTLTYEAYMRRVKPDDIVAYLFPDPEPQEGEAGPFREELAADAGGDSRHEDEFGDVAPGGAGTEESGDPARDGYPTLRV